MYIAIDPDGGREREFEVCFNDVELFILQARKIIGQTQRRTWNNPKEKKKNLLIVLKSEAGS
jgi:hypothetical protein